MFILQNTTLIKLKGKKMTVKQLIEILKEFEDSDLEVMIEINHGDIKDLEKEHIEKVKITDWGSVIWWEEEENEETLKNILLIR